MEVVGFMCRAANRAREAGECERGRIKGPVFAASSVLHEPMKKTRNPISVREELQALSQKRRSQNRRQ